jgi:hypothetical protein
VWTRKFADDTLCGRKWRHSKGRSYTEFADVVQQIEQILIDAISTGTLDFILSIAGGRDSCPIVFALRQASKS